jgi:hypothetical protein
MAHTGLEDYLSKVRQSQTFPIFEDAGTKNIW